MAREMEVLVVESETAGCGCCVQEPPPVGQRVADLLARRTEIESLLEPTPAPALVSVR